MKAVVDIEQDVARQAVEALRAGLGERLVAVVLYGSRTRGDAHERSDWDLLVIAEGLPEGYWDRCQFIGRLLSRCTGPVVAIAKTPAEFEERAISLYLDIALDGRILYDPRGYTGQKLALLQRLIEKLGLYRERTEAGNLWQWTEPPTSPWKLAWEA
jgi:predicted nucleotidyltransferase